MAASTAKQPTVDDCDRQLRAWVALLKHPESDRDDCREQIDRWLDVRLSLTPTKENR